MTGFFPVLVTLICLLNEAASLEMDTADGGYKNLLIAIHHDVPYDEEIVTNIKSLLGSSSEFLHRATKGRVYFKHATILFPNTWPERSSAVPVSTNLFEMSDVRVQLPASAEEDRPYTRQTRPCGQPGDFIQIPSAFLAELNSSTAAKYINPAYVFVHEWAHYRYGVFDEYGSQDDDTFPLTYCIENKVRLNSCSGKFRFRARRDNGEKCLISMSCQFEEKCRVQIFLPPSDLVESSIMFMPYMNNITHFCDSNQGIRQHNPLAPNRQNRICKGKSTWDVISENEDFGKAPLPDMSKPTEMSFNEAQELKALPQRVVLVLDVSKSMDKKEHLELLKEGATRYIMDVADGTRRMAIIAYCENARVHHTLMPVNVNTRAGFLKALQRLWACKDRCIGCGLQKALQVLRTSDETSQGATIVLMCTGKGNQKPSVADVMPEIMAAKVEVNTVSLGAEANDEIEQLAIATKGKALVLQEVEGNKPLQIEAAIMQATTTQADEASDIFTTVVDTSLSFTQSLKVGFTLDGSLGRTTIIIVFCIGPICVRIEIWLSDPTGERCYACSIAGNETMKTISIPGMAKAGKWTLHIKSATSDEAEVRVQVKSQSKDLDDRPIRVTARMTKQQVGKPNEAIILAEITKGKKIVLDAQVTAVVSRPNPPHKVLVALHDDGRDPDIQANDGTYSGYFTAFNGKGRYSVTAHLSSQKKARLADRRPGSGSMYTTAMLILPAESDPETKYEYSVDDFILVNTTSEDENVTSTGCQRVSDFHRVISAGSFQVTEEIFPEQVPPGVIQDLAVAGTRRDETGSLLVKLTWTWPGAHLDNGNASYVELRVTDNYRKLKSDFDKQTDM